MYPLSLQELGSDNTAYLDLFTILLSLIFYWSIVKRSKELSKLQYLWDFYILFHKFKRKQFFFSLVPRYYGLSLLRTLYLPHEGVRNNGSRLYRGFWSWKQKFLELSLERAIHEPINKRIDTTRQEDQESAKQCYQMR